MSEFLVRRAGAQETAATELILQADGNLITGEKSFVECFGGAQPTSHESDMLLVASAIFAADRASKRGEREDLARTITLDIPVVNIERFLSVHKLIEQVLRVLSNDGWRIRFRQANGVPERERQWREQEGLSLLFSGGLDSFAAAVEFAPTRQLQLVSHATQNQQTRAAQNSLLEVLRTKGIPVDHKVFFVSSRDSGGPTAIEHAAESSQRSRSFLFLVLAGVAARRAGHRRLLWIAENGQMAINLPLSQARIGAFSTHTAHPDVLGIVEEILQKLLAVPIRIENPYVLKTKREVIEPIWSNARDGISVAVSCWKNARLPAGYAHCGQCVPCIIRRVAIESLGLDETRYVEDVFRKGLSLPPESDGRRNLVEVGEFIVRIETLSDDEIKNEWPDLYSPRIDAPGVIAMYRRFASEARSVLSGYPAAGAILQ